MLVNMSRQLVMQYCGEAQAPDQWHLIDRTATCAIGIHTARAGPDSSCLCQTKLHGLGILIGAARICWPWASAAPGSCTQQQELSPAGLPGILYAMGPCSVKQCGRHGMTLNLKLVQLVDCMVNHLLWHSFQDAYQCAMIVSWREAPAVWR